MKKVLFTQLLMKILQKMQSSSSFQFLKLKQDRLRFILAKIKNNLVSNQVRFHTSRSNGITNTNIEIPKLTSCRDVSSGKQKHKCKDCNAPCLLPIERFFSPKRLKQAEIIKELEFHNHPKSRIMNDGQQRTTHQAAKELVEHYVIAHNIKIISQR